MDESQKLPSSYRRYGELLAAFLRTGLRRCTPFKPATEAVGAIQLERGVVFAQALLGQVMENELLAPLLQTLEPPLERITIVDRAGHRRPVYRALLIYAVLKAFQLGCETHPRSESNSWEQNLRPWCDLLEARLADANSSFNGAGRGAKATEAAWSALALFIAGEVFERASWAALATETFESLARGQQPTGAILSSTASDNPETMWYDELVLLHAMSSFAVQAKDRGVAAAVQRAAVYHLAEIQPDHATSQPWGVFAFIWNAQTQPLADQILHAADMQHPEGLDGVSLILLADALACLRTLATDAAAPVDRVGD